MHYDSNAIIMLLIATSLCHKRQHSLQYLIGKKMKTQYSVAKEADVQCNFYVNCVMILPTKPVIFNKNSLVLNRDYYMQIRQSCIEEVFYGLYSTLNNEQRSENRKYTLLYITREIPVTYLLKSSYLIYLNV